MTTHSNEFDQPISASSAADHLRIHFAGCNGVPDAALDSLIRTQQVEAGIIPKGIFIAKNRNDNPAPFERLVQKMERTSGGR